MLLPPMLLHHLDGTFWMGRSGWDVYAGPVAEHRRTAAPFLLPDDLHVQRRAVLQLPLRPEDDSGP